MPSQNIDNDEVVSSNHAINQESQSKSSVLHKADFAAEESSHVESEGVSRTLSASEHISLKEFAKSLKFNKGNLTRTQVGMAKIRSNFDEGEIVLVLPPMSKGEYSEGFEYYFRLHPPRSFKECVAYVVLKARGDADYRAKDYILTANEIGEPIEKAYVNSQSKEYVLSLGRISGEEVRRLFILGQYPPRERKRTLKLHISGIVIKYYDVVRKTDAYINNLKISELEKRGTDFASERYSIKRLNNPVDKINHPYDYDFENLRVTERSLRGIDRKRVLRHIFEAVTEGANTGTEKHLAVLKFVHKVSYSAGLQPMYPDKIMVTDPLILLELGEMACGQANRLAIDLFASAGVPGRLVQMGQHVTCEIFYDNKWHYFDGIIFGNGETVLGRDGYIPSIEELSQSPFAIDALSFNLERSGVQVNSSYYPSWWYFGRNAYNLHPPALYKKVQDASTWTRLYGWEGIDTVPDSGRRLYDFEPFYEPGAVVFKSIEALEPISRTHVDVFIEWEPSIDKDRDLLGYRVYCSESSRGWSQSAFGGADRTKRFWNNLGGWKPEMYEKMFQEPPHEIAFVETQESSVRLSLEVEKTYFLTVMPFDSHGKMVGRKLYQMSSEIKLDKYNLGIVE